MAAGSQAARALLNGAYAFAGVVEFWNSQRARDSGGQAAHEFARTATQVRWALDDLANAEGLTAAGRRLIAGMAATADGWDVDAAARSPRSDTAVDLGQGPPSQGQGFRLRELSGPS